MLLHRCSVKLGMFHALVVPNSARRSGGFGDGARCAPVLHCELRVSRGPGTRPAPGSLRSPSRRAERPVMSRSRPLSAHSARHAERRTALLVERARGMRHAPTATEAALWRQLSGSRLGVAFRRQVPLGRFIVDFLAPSAALVVEVDGGYHRGRAAADARRDAWLQREGYRVLRIPAALVERRLEEAVALVGRALAR